MRYSPVRPYVMVSRDDPRDPASRFHLHVVVGRKDGKLVSVQLTHSPFVPGLRTKAVPDNVERSYCVDTAYVRNPKDYLAPYYPSNYFISSRDRIAFENVAKRTRKPLR